MAQWERETKPGPRRPRATTVGDGCAWLEKVRLQCFWRSKVRGRQAHSSNRKQLLQIRKKKYKKIFPSLFHLINEAQITQKQT